MGCLSDLYSLTVENLQSLVPGGRGGMFFMGETLWRARGLLCSSPNASLRFQAVMICNWERTISRSWGLMAPAALRGLSPIT